VKTISKPPTHKTGILLINLGTPDATDYASMRRYLKQFLSDKNVVPARGPVWWLILHLIILRRRPHSLGRAYDAIWNREDDESPLRSFTRAQADGVAPRFPDMPGLEIDWAMRYGTPSIAQGINALTQAGCTQMVLFPLYPQYSASTTGSALSKAMGALQKLVAQPATRTIAPYFAHPAYIAALAASVRAHHATLDWQPELTLASLHGVPVKFIENGDPYQAQCEHTVKLLRAELGMDEQSLPLSYQSKSNRKQWLGPDTEATLTRLAREGVRNLSLIAPGFAADGVETLEELGLRATQVFRDAGGENITLVPCLNASAPGLDMLETLIRENL